MFNIMGCHGCGSLFDCIKQYTIMDMSFKALPVFIWLFGSFYGTITSVYIIYM